MSNQQPESLISRPDEIDREMHEVEARNFAVAADRAAADGRGPDAKNYALVSQAHSLVALTQLYGDCIEKGCRESRGIAQPPPDDDQLVAPLLTDEAVRELTKQIVEGSDGEVISLPYEVVKDALIDVIRQQSEGEGKSSGVGVEANWLIGPGDDGARVLDGPGVEENIAVVPEHRLRSAEEALLQIAAARYPNVAEGEVLSAASPGHRLWDRIKIARDYFEGRTVWHVEDHAAPTQQSVPEHSGEEEDESVDRPLWFERNEHGRLEELRNGDEPNRGIVLLTPLEPHHIQALLGALRDRGEDDDLPAARQLLVSALEAHHA